MDDSNQIFADISEYTISKEANFPYSKYVSYTIRITTKNYNWNIVKRFRNFEELHQKLTKLKLYASSLPYKKFFFNLSKDFIEERMHLLEFYLNDILYKNNLNNCPDILEFIELDHDTFHLFLGKNKTFHDKKLNVKNSSGIHNANNIMINDLLEKSRSGPILFESNCNKDMKIVKPSINVTGRTTICTFLHNLIKFPQNKTTIVKDFQNIHLKSKSMQRVKKVDIALLFFGDDNIPGLLSHCGAIDSNKLGAEVCINLLAKLLNSEFNSVYDDFIEIFQTSKLEQIKLMNLNLHLNAGNLRLKTDLYKIIKILINEDSEEDENYKVDDILNDKETIDRIQNSFHNKFNYLL